MTNTTSSSSTCCRIFIATFLSLVCLGSATASSKSETVQKLKIVGGLGAAPRYARLEAPFWTRDLARLSAGKFAAEIVPLDQAGVSGQDMLRLIQLGVVPFGTALLSQLTAQDPEFSAPDLAGLNPDMKTLRKTVAAFRSYLERTLRQQREVEVLAIYAYPAQVVFCNKPLSSLRSLAGRQVRVSGPSAADFVEALGGMPVVTAFNEIVSNMQTRNIDCAITGAMAGNAIGLHRLTTHLHSMPVSWGLALFGANSSTWEQLDPELKSLLRRELPRLEAAIWDDAERETTDGIACNTGATSCTRGSAGSMTIISSTVEDNQLRKEILRSQVLPRWVQRCGSSCSDLWNKTLAPVTGIKAPK